MLEHAKREGSLKGSPSKPTTPVGGAIVFISGLRMTNLSSQFKFNFSFTG